MDVYATAPPRLELDHIVFAAAPLADGVAFLEERLGARLPPGGKHPLMGTHNALMRLGEDIYCEVISVDPEAPAPARARWFGLDDPAIREEIADRPRLLTWVARSADIARSRAASPIDLGDVIGMSRAALSWRITVRHDGTMPEDGLLPALIEWPRGPHPSRAMADFGIRLERLTLFHDDPVRLKTILHGIRASHLVEVEPAAHADRRMEAVLRTPKGLVVVH